MTPLWTAADLAHAVGGVAHGDAIVTGVASDSREIEPGWAFVALKGEAMDGHRFVGQAFARGAATVVISDASALDRPDRPHILVDDVSNALTTLGHAARGRTNAVIVGVTGSAGKTGVKEATRLCLERFRPNEVHASVKSYNNHVGVPLSLARMPVGMRFGVFEMGMNHAGELTALSAIVRPHVAMITTVASAHREFFDSEEGIADAKAEIFSGLQAGGTAIINRDNRHYLRLRAAAECSPAEHILTFGMSDGDVRALRRVATADGTAMTADVAGDILTFKINQPGAHWALNALGVLAIVKAAGGDLGLAGLALAELPGLDGRGARRTIATKSGTAILIDESYNANPASMVASLDVLGMIQPEGRGRRIAVLGDMRELGSESQAFHEGLASAVIAAGVDLAILVGTDMHYLAQALAGRVTTEHCADAAEALPVVRQAIRNDDVVLIKASNSIRLGDVVAALSNPESVPC